MGLRGAERYASRVALIGVALEQQFSLLFLGVFAAAVGDDHCDDCDADDNACYNPASVARRVIGDVVSNECYLSLVIIDHDEEIADEGVT